MEKGYGINLKYGISQKRLWFMGKSTEESEENWKTAVNNLNDIGDSSISFDDFLNKAKENFRKYNFQEYKM